ncbi:SAP domain-containing protein [Alkalibacterium sp. MB6]|uniref:SAP domain-containing protein n=1 Tax=Alkalibacterium sp. MB6 TaxID=2081965 RepID=UPI00137B7B62|nr:SAP domain-containing protein [Alkalibacterium sp. MB6]
MNAVDILVLHYLSDKDETYELNQSFWKDRYSANINKIVNQLVRKGYIKLEVDVEKSLNTLKVDQLKSILKANELPVSGKKKDLINRIKDAADVETYISKLNKVWLPTERGKEVINNTDYLMYTHRNLSSFMTVVDAFNTKRNNPQLNDKEVLIHSLESSYNYSQETSRFKRNLVFPLWEASKICRNYDDYYGQFLFLVRSCVSNFSSQETLSMEYLLQDFDYFMDTYKIPEMVTNDLKILLSVNPEYTDQLYSVIEESIKSLDLKTVFTASEIKDSINFSMDMDENNLINTYKEVFSRSGGKKTPHKKTAKSKKSIFETLGSIYDRLKR